MAYSHIAKQAARGELNDELRKAIDPRTISALRSRLDLVWEALDNVAIHFEEAAGHEECGPEMKEAYGDVYEDVIERANDISATLNVLHWIIRAIS